MSTFPMKTEPAEIRWLIERDMDQVLALDGEWDWEAWAFWRRQANCFPMVYEEQMRVRGAMLYLIHSESITLVRFLTEDEQIRDALLERLEQKLSPLKRHTLVYDVDERDLPLQVALRGRGYKAVAVVREDVVDRFRMILEVR